MNRRSSIPIARVSVTFQRNAGWIVLDQIRTVDRRRITRKPGKINKGTIDRVRNILMELLVR
jgi:mRNA interferase MazF